jgi:hypothetical protein
MGILAVQGAAGQRRKETESCEQHRGGDEEVVAEGRVEAGRRGRDEAEPSRSCRPMADSGGKRRSGVGSGSRGVRWSRR